MPTSFAIVTPSFNQGDYLDATIHSVLRQHYPRLDYLVMDACSTDRTADVLARHADRVRSIVELDEGQTDAIVKGFARTQGDVLGWLNADDTLADGALQAVAEVFDAEPSVDVVYGDATYIDAAGRPIAPCAHVEAFNRRRLRHVSDFIVQPACFFRRSAYERAGGLDPSLHWAMDWDLWLKLEAAGARFRYVPRVLAHYRWVGENKSAVGGDARIDEIAAMTRRHGVASLPAYCRLERANLRLGDAIAAARAGRPLASAIAVARGAAAVLVSPRATMSLLSPHTWQIIRTGARLRRATAGLPACG